MVRVNRTARTQRPPEVADGVFRLGTRWVNCYLVTDGASGLLVDAGYPRYDGRIEAATAALGLRMSDIEAAIVTHHHVDHAGTAQRLQSAGSDIFVMAADAPIVRGEEPSHPPTGFYRQAWRLSMLRYLAHTVRAGGARYRPCPHLHILAGNETLDLPARPRVVATPGHTAGHCSVVLDDRGVLLTGDALVNFDYASGADGLQLHRFNEDRDLARRSLDRLADVAADIVLFGHGEPWTRGVAAALERVRRQSSSPD